MKNIPTFLRIARGTVRVLRQGVPAHRTLATCFAGAAAVLFINLATAATLIVTTLADGGAGSLRDAIAASNATIGVADTINFDVSGTITIASRLPDIEGDLTIDGEGQEITVDGNNSVQVFFVGADKTLKLAKITIANGYCASPCSGGAILNVGTLKVSGSTFSGNSALLGGAIHNFGVLEISGSTFSRNSARFGGAIHNFYSSKVTNSKFFGNSATRTGGAIYNFDTLSVIKSAFSGNSAIGTGSDVFNGAEVATMFVHDSPITWHGISCVGACSASFNSPGGAFVRCDAAAASHASLSYDTNLGNLEIASVR
jgi:hypothetical protein